MATADISLTNEYDVIVVGAGISGINAAYRLQTETPNHSFAILESREVIGGTWDLFRYPGIRSDSDLHTFGYPWRPWNEEKEIADGASILNYIKASASEHGLDKKVKFGHKLLAADWSTKDLRWHLTVDVKGTTQIFKARFVIFSTGYYDYDKPLETVIPGLDSFMGQVVHPQFWPEDLEYANKKVVIIGSGATAVTLLPNLAKTAENVIMLQRSPSYILPIASKSSGDWIRAAAPTRVADFLVRWKHILIQWFFYKFCRTWPNFARKTLIDEARSKLPKDIPTDPHFTPSYMPWDERICFCPDGDFFAALKEGNAQVVTDTIQTVNEKGILTSSGEFLEADIIVTATGLRILVAGGARILKDGKDFSFTNKFFWNGSMLQDFPNAAYMIGYGNLSWTLGIDVTARIVCKLLRKMEKDNIAMVVPRVAPNHGMEQTPVFQLKSSYVQKGKHLLPISGDKAPWKPRDNSVRDILFVHWGDITKDMEFIKSGEIKKTN